MTADEFPATPGDASHSTAIPGDPDAHAFAAPPDRGEGGATGGGPHLQGLRRARHGRMVGGVCAGVAECFGVDVTVVRIAAVVFAVAGGLAVPIYLAMWLLVPEEGTGHTILSSFMRGPIGPRPATAEAVNTQGGAMAPSSPFSAPSDDQQWSQVGAYRWHGGWWRGGGMAGDQGMRIGDAERTQVSETLSKHYAAGRLDDEEFNHRMGQAMGSKTRGDLSGLLADLPPEEADPGSITRRHRHGFGFGSLLMLCLTVVVIGSIASTIWWVPRPHFAWIALAVGAFLLLRWERHRHWHRAHGA